MRAVAAALVAVLAAACAQDVTAPEVLNLDRPSAITFGCWGDFRPTNGAEPDPDQNGPQKIISSTMPTAVCAGYKNFDDAHAEWEKKKDQADAPPEPKIEDFVPASQLPLPGENTVNPILHQFIGFVLQPTKGSVVVAALSADGTDNASTTGINTSGGVLDTDPFTPGRNAIPIGTLPVDLATSADSCYVVSANAGSCDLSTLDIDTAVDTSVPAKVVHVQPRNASGEAILAKPAAILGQPETNDDGYTCPDQPQGVVYVAYPDCNLVGVIEPATGDLVAGIRFGDGTVEITDGNVTCNAQCGDGAVASRITVGGPGRPVDLDIGVDDSGNARLYIGAENLPAVTYVDLDADYLPTAVSQVDLYGEVGVRRLVASPVINMGGTTGNPEDGTAGLHQFVYAIATDDTVRVVEVRNRMYECDTQVDPRYLHDVTDVSFLACMQVGDVNTPPRRANRRSPGIHIPGTPFVQYNGVPLDLTFVQVTKDQGAAAECSQSELCGKRMSGYFALVSAADGAVFIVNVDDDRYTDFESPSDPSKAMVPLAIAHQLRDRASARDLIDEKVFTSTEDSNEVIYEGPQCLNIDSNPEVGPPRVADTVARVFDTSRMTADKAYQQPTVRNQMCIGKTGEGVTADDLTVVEALASDLSFTAPIADRELAYPDLMSLTNETVRLTWEGLLSLDSTQSAIDGPPTRIGFAEPSGGALDLVDSNRPFCRAGVEPYDILELEGCDPTKGDAECSLGQTCYADPNAPAKLLGSGTCLEDGRLNELTVSCSDFINSDRRYTITETNAGDVVAMPRRYALELTPIDGCASADECVQLQQASADLGNPEDPIELRNATCDTNAGVYCPSGYTCRSDKTCAIEPYNWVCEEDPSRQPGKSWCQISCTSSADCLEGNVCGGDGYCVLAPVPPAECVTGLQRYRLRVGEAYALVGEFTGFLHNRIYDENTGACIDDPDPDPLALGRVPLTAPPCTGDGITDVSPNPCSLTVSHTDLVPDVAVSGNTCEPVDPTDPERFKFITRDVPAIRVQTPSMRFNVANIGTHGDRDCVGDELGEYPLFPAVHAGTQIRFSISGGIYPLAVATGAGLPARLQLAPDGGVWMLDQSDAAGGGQIIRLLPKFPGSTFAPQIISLGQ